MGYWTRRLCAPPGAAHYGCPPSVQGGVTFVVQPLLGSDAIRCLQSEPVVRTTSLECLSLTSEGTDAANRKKKGRGAHGGALHQQDQGVERPCHPLRQDPASSLAGLHILGAVIWLRSLRPAT